jgi:DNA-directed RNA polymerase specialized sigma24 family protein
MLTATGTIGGVLFAAWAGLDRLHASRQVAAGRRERAATVALHHAIAGLPQARRRIVENAYFGGLSSLHITRTLGLPSTGLAY